MTRMKLRENDKGAASSRNNRRKKKAARDERKAVFSVCLDGDDVAHVGSIERVAANTQRNKIQSCLEGTFFKKTMQKYKKNVYATNA
jgi:hypothetical protein